MFEGTDDWFEVKPDQVSALWVKYVDCWRLKYNLINWIHDQYVAYTRNQSRAFYWSIVAFVIRLLIVNPLAFRAGYDILFAAWQVNIMNPLICSVLSIPMQPIYSCVQ